MSAGLASYVPRLLLEWQRDTPDAIHRKVEGTLVFTDLSGFTALSEKLAKLGKLGAEELTEHLDAVFSVLLADASSFGGSMLKFGGDALLIFFWGPGHAGRACSAAGAMRTSLRRVGLITTSSGKVRLRMSVGVHSGAFDFFLVGRSHRELIVTGPDASTVARMEATAGAGEILMSEATAAMLPAGARGDAKGDGFLLARRPRRHSLPDELQLAPADIDAEQFLPVALRQHLAVEGHEAEHRQVTVAFVQFSGVDSLLAREGPDEVARQLDALVSVAQDACEEYGVSFLYSDVYADGGKFIVAAGTPTAFDDNEERMLRAVEAMHLATFDLDVRIGLHRGHVFAGDIGPSFRRSYTIMGDAVNTAARVAAHAEPRTILATDDVLRRSRTLFAVEPLAPFAAKGKAKPLTAYQVRERLAARGNDDASRLPLVGRDAELRDLTRAVTDATTGVAQLVEIVGEAGMGKTRLAQALVDSCRDLDVVRAQCEQYEQATPYAAVRSALIGALGFSAPADPDQLGALVATALPTLEPMLPLIALPLGVDVPSTPEVDRIDPGRVRDRVHQVIGELLNTVNAGPALWLIEDVQWMDDASAGLVQFLASAPRPWCFVITRRPTVSGFRPAEVGVRLELAALPPDAAASLARAAAGETPILPSQFHALVERAGGNPLFLRELAAYAAAGGADVPDSVEGLLASRLDALDADGRSLLRTAAVVGMTFEQDLVDELAGRVMREHPGWHQLHELVEPADDGRLRFRNALVQQIAYEGLPYRRRRALHDEVGTIIEIWGGGEDQAERLSLHFHEAGNAIKTWEYSRLAARRAVAKAAHADAVTFFERALGAGRRLDLSAEDLSELWEASGESLRRAGRGFDALAAYRKARHLGTRNPDRLARLLYLEGNICREHGKLASAMRSYRRALQLSLSPSLRSELLGACAQARYRQGNYRACVSLCEEALTMAETAGARQAAANAHTVLGAASLSLGASDATSHWHQALELYEELGDHLRAGLVLNNLGAEAYYRGQWRDAIALNQRAQVAQQAEGDTVQAAVAATNAAEILADQGRRAEARAILDETLGVFRAARSLLWELFALSVLARLTLYDGDAEGARRLVIGVRERVAGAGTADSRAGADIRLLEIEILLAERDYDAAGVALEQSEASLSDAEGAHVWRLRGYVESQSGHAAAALAALDESTRIARERSDLFALALSLDTRARLCPDDVTAVEEATELFAGLGVVAPPRLPIGGARDTEGGVPG